jgi:hypothetical protein
MVTKVIKKDSLAKYTWTQTKESLTLSFAIKNVALKNIDVMIADLVLKVNVPSIRFFAVIDFPLAIDFESSRNRSQLTDESLEVFLIKAEAQMWDDVQVRTLPPAELNERRNASI